MERGQEAPKSKEQPADPMVLVYLLALIGVLYYGEKVLGFCFRYFAS